MAILRATYRMNMTTGEADEAAVNVWHFTHIGEFSPEIVGGAVATGLHNFYRAIANTFSGMVSRAANAHVCTIATVTPGAPGSDDDTVSKVGYQSTSGVAWPATSSSLNLPPEIAMCLSFRGNVVGLSEESGLTRPIARRRGRVFLGPFNASALAGSGPPLFTTNQITDARNTYTAMIAEINTPSDIYQIKHVIYSPTTGDAHEVEDCWVDNAPDIIRNRGTRSTARVTATVAQPD